MVVLLDPLEYVAGLAVESPANAFERGETDRFGATVFQYGDVRRRDADFFGELADGHATLGEEYIKVHADCHSDHRLEFVMLCGGGDKQRPQHDDQHEHCEQTQGDQQRA